MKSKRIALALVVAFSLTVSTVPVMADGSSQQGYVMSDSFIMNILIGLGFVSGERIYFNF